MGDVDCKAAVYWQKAEMVCSQRLLIKNAVLPLIVP